MEPRIAPAAPPYAPEIQAHLDRIMPPGAPPLTLFTTLARDLRLFSRFMGGGLLDKGRLTLRQREIVIDRVTAQCGSVYEWGVHVAFFARRVELTDEQIKSLAIGSPADPCWTAADERLLIRLCDQLHASCAIDDDLWGALSDVFSPEATIELLMLAGFYRTVSYVTNGLRLPPESFGAPLPTR